MIRRCLVGVALGAFLLAAPGRAEFGEQVVFRADASVVALYVTVRDRDGRLVPDLPREAFEVFDDGVRVPIAVFSNEPQPITAVVMADLSGSVGFEGAPRVLAVLRHLISDLRDGDQFRLGAFNGNEVALSHAFTHDPTELERVVTEEIWMSGSSGTALWRAVDVAMRALATESGRQVVLVLTDGLDNPSGFLPALPGGASGLQRRVATNSQLLVYAIGVDSNPRTGRILRGGIVNLVRASGGGHFDLSPNAELKQEVARVSNELRSQYVVGFVPLHQDGREHRVEVRTTVRGATVRARESYVAGGAPPKRPSVDVRDGGR